MFFVNLMRKQEKNKKNCVSFTACVFFLYIFFNVLKIFKLFGYSGIIEEYMFLAHHFFVIKMRSRVRSLVIYIFALY